VAVNVPILNPPEHRWECPNCDVTAVTRWTEPHTEMHHCAGLAGLWAPMVAAGVKAKVEMLVREDYVNGEDIRYDGEGRPAMAVRTTRDDGTDLAVYAPTAHGRLGF
jgi:hypothetical protein